MIQVFEMVVLIVAIAVIGKVAIYYIRQKGRARPAAEIENERLRAEIGDLKTRIATLERIAVDKRQRLADEIDALDDKR